IWSQRQALDFRTFNGVLTLPELLVDVDGRPISEDEAEVYPCGLQSVSIFNDDFRLYRKGDNAISEPPHLKPPVTSPLPWLDMQTYEIGKAYREALHRNRSGPGILKKGGEDKDGGEGDTDTTTRLQDEEEKIKKALAQGEEGDKGSEEGGGGEGGGAWEEEISIDSSDVAYHWDFLRYMALNKTWEALHSHPWILTSNERFRVWLHPPFTPSFQKLYGVINDKLQSQDQLILHFNES
ncbi:lem3 cdc50 family protein, partial [Cystoisospora suis]